jgi:hypothetical protein
VAKLIFIHLLQESLYVKAKNRVKKSINKKIIDREKKRIEND